MQRTLNSRDYDLVAFATHGENFAHVISETRRAGTPVLVSERTPWQTDPSGAISVVALGDTEGWRQQLKAAVDRTEQQKDRPRTVTRDFACDYARTSGTTAENLTMFRKVARVPPLTQV